MQTSTCFQDGLKPDDYYYLRLAAIKFSEYFKRLMPEGRQLFWVHPNLVDEPQQFRVPIKHEKCEFYYDDPELEGVIPHSTGSARTEGYYKITKQHKRLMRRHEHHNERTIISTHVNKFLECCRRGFLFLFWIF